MAWGGLEKRSLGEGDAGHCVLFNGLGIIQRLGVDFLPWDSRGQDEAFIPNRRVRTLMQKRLDLSKVSSGR